jgi:hypothetical protein
MTRQQFAFLVWSSVQIFFVTVFITVLWRLGQLLRMARREAKTLTFMASMMTTWAQRWGDDPMSVQGELLRHVEQYGKREAVPPSWMAVFLSWLWRR